MTYFNPNIVANKITDINEDVLKRFNVKAVLLDIDNTLSPHGSDTLYDGVYKWLNDIKNIGIDIMIISNSKKIRVDNFAKNIGIDYYVSDAKKPLSFGFNKAIKKLDVNRENILIIGDQIFTDILGANLAGIKSALVEPKDKNEPTFIKIKRFFEIPIKAMIKYKYKNKKGRIS